MMAEHPPSAVRENAAKPDGHTHEVLGLFEAKAEGWAEKYAPGGPLAGRVASLSAAIARCAHAEARVLDLGCGTGELACALAAAGFRVAGCDISPKMLSHAPRDHGRGAEWVQLEPDWQRLPFASVTFDVVVAASLLEYVSEPAVVLRECARVLRPGGVMLYTVPDLRHPVRWAEWCAQRLSRGKPSGNSARSPQQRYRAYLSASLQRHRVGWWTVVSESIGLRPVQCSGGAGRSTLRLFICRRTDQIEVPVMTTAMIAETAQFYASSAPPDTLTNKVSVESTMRDRQDTGFRLFLACAFGLALRSLEHSNRRPSFGCMP
jgi:SAM-dependent methyltransferase